MVLMLIICRYHSSSRNINISSLVLDIMRLFDFDVFNPMRSSDEVIGVVVVLIWVITYPADLELRPSMLDSTCPDLLPTLRLCPIHPSQLCQYSTVSLTQKMSPSQVEEFPTAFSLVALTPSQQETALRTLLPAPQEGWEEMVAEVIQKGAKISPERVIRIWRSTPQKIPGITADITWVEMGYQRFDPNKKPLKGAGFLHIGENSRHSASIHPSYPSSPRHVQQ
jgi:hypothetical protein